jgi:hypothetical protein
MNMNGRILGPVTRAKRLLFLIKLFYVIVATTLITHFACLSLFKIFHLRLGFVMLVQF